ncbi:MAG: RMD1 family protein [Fusobacteria bacterium]|nr:RMD1 family protein [Fusobacteriota bacterium]
MKTKRYKLIAYSTTMQINLKPIFAHFEMSKKIHWRDYIVFSPQDLLGIVKAPELKFVHLYQFGSIVFTNFTFHEAVNFIKYIDKITPKAICINEKIDSEEYIFIVDTQADETEALDDSIIVSEHKPHSLDIVANIMAKSVAMDRIELDVDRLLGECEGILEKMKIGNFSTSNKKLFKLSAEILEFKFNTVSSVRLLDKPDLTWDKENLNEIYTELSGKFELISRYENLSAKHETLLDIINVFTSLTQDKHGVRLEWVVIILIAIEIILTISKFLQI